MGIGDWLIMLFIACVYATGIGSTVMFLIIICFPPKAKGITKSNRKV